MESGETIREGFMKKSASSKKDDKVRDNWKERWFVLKGHTLIYYKRREDRTPKGKMDLRAAKIDMADMKTGKPFSLRIAQAKQVFTYLLCANQADQGMWLQGLRKSAGYDLLNPEGSGKTPTDRQGALCSYGVLLMNNDSMQPERVVLLANTDHTIQILKDDQIYESYPAKNVVSVVHALAPDLSLKHVDGVTHLFSVKVELKTVKDKEIVHINRKLYCGTLLEAEQLEKLLKQLACGDFSTVRSISKHPIQATAQIRLGDMEPTHNWVPRYAVLAEKKCLLFRRSESTLPTWAIWVHTAKLELENETTIKIKSGVETCLFEFDSNEVCDLWMEMFKEIQEKYGGKEEKGEYKVQKPEDDEPPSEDEDKKDDESVPQQPVEWKLYQYAQYFDTEDESYLCAWGHAADGQLGNAETADVTVPICLPIITRKRVRSIAAGANHAGAVTVQGHIYMWGDGQDGQLGLGASIKKSNRPSLLTAVLREGKFAHLALGDSHSLGVTEHGRIYGWGNNSTGQLGDADLKENMVYPTKIKFFEKKKCKYLEAGGDHSAAICEDNEIYLWGDNSQGECGTGGQQKAHFTPAMIHSLSKGKDKIVQVSCAQGVTGVVTDAGRLYTFGNNERGQLGHGDMMSKKSPKEVDYVIEHNMKVQQIAMGANHAIALAIHKGQPIVLTWGGAVTNGFQEDQVFPAVVSALEKTVFVHASDTHSVSINSELKLFSFGVNKYGELGNGKAGVQALVRVRLNRECRVVSAKCGNGFTIALLKGLPPDTVASAHYAPPKASERAPPPDYSKVPGLGHGIVVSEDGAESKIAELLNSFNVKPADPKADRYATKYGGGGVSVGAPSGPYTSGGRGAPAKKVIEAPPPPAYPDSEEDDDELPPPPEFPPPPEAEEAAEEHQKKFGAVNAELSKKLAADAARFQRGGQVQRSGASVSQQQRPAPARSVAPSVSQKQSISMPKTPFSYGQVGGGPSRQPAPSTSVTRQPAPSTASVKPAYQSAFLSGEDDPDLPPEPTAEEPSQEPAQEAEQPQEEEPVYQDEQPQPQEEEQHEHQYDDQGGHQGQEYAEDQPAGGQDDYQGQGGQEYQDDGQGGQEYADGGDGGDAQDAQGGMDQPLEEETQSPGAEGPDSPMGEDGQPKKKEKKKKKKELPPGWKKVKDPKSGRSYYYNQTTRETTWKRPKVKK